MLIGFIYDVKNDNLSILKEKFNKYSQENKLNINLNTYFYTHKNSTSEISNVSYILKDLVSEKEKSKNDLFIIDTIYSGEYSDHFEDLYNLLPPSTINLYKNGIATATSVCNGKLVSLPLYVDYGGLYYNEILLNKYNKTIPLTWDEMIQTFNYIYDREYNLGNNLSKFLSILDGKSIVANTLEFIHSFRDNENDEFPPYTSKNAIDALIKMKEIKESITEYDPFSISQSELWKSIYNKQKEYIFFRNWYYGDVELPPNKDGLKRTSYKFAPLPGHKAGISGSCIGGSNIALNKYISEEKKKAAIEVYKYLFSYDFQKYLIINLNKRSAIHDLYKDDEVCQNINCTMYSHMQGIVRPSYLNINYEDFSTKLSKYIKDFINGKNTAEETLIKIDDILRVHFIEYTSISGIIILTLIVVSLLIIAVTYIYISIKRSRKQFNFLPFKHWCCFLLGLALLVCSCLTGVGSLKDINCTLKPVLISIGFSLTYMPFFIKLISLQSQKNRLFNFIKNNSQLILVFSIFIDIIINLVWMTFDPVLVQKEEILDGPSFEICKSSGDLGFIMIIILLIKSIIIIGSIGFLILTEWNVVIFKSDIRHIGNAVYFSIINIIVYMVVIFIHIMNRYFHNGIRCGVIIVFSLSNLFLILGPKIYKISFYKKKINKRKNLNKFIEKTGAFNDNYQNELNLINIDDIIDYSLIRNNNMYNNNNNNSHLNKMNYTYRDFNVPSKNSYIYSNYLRGDLNQFPNTVSNLQFIKKPTIDTFR
ncbi:periplasmic binding protein-like II [Piromyces finnis]|uniref:Periplasmic binding protein-like II n=1 Tax=Piromyces finnis TaxID=1754191 RepID=A0A1Y1UWJ6_9FUNG|nr:periplasmic binding protein-like II [Piromyces finnis]|eukprot:ORX42463.1 periplasmic binding protein-like II [Piromyces finnis]